MNRVAQEITGSTISDRHFRDMVAAGLDLVDQGVTVFDAHLRLISCNSTFLRLLDFPDTLAAPGTPFESFIRHNAKRREYGPGDADTQVAERVAIAREFRAHSTRRVRPDGTMLSIRGFPLPHQGFITLYSDITESERQKAQIENHQIELEAKIAQRTAQLTAANAELRGAIDEKENITAALRVSEAKLRLITDTIPAHIAYFDDAWTYRYANRRYAEWFGLTSESIVGRTIREVVGEAIFTEVEARVVTALAGTEASYEYTVTDADGTRRFARSTLLPDITPSGKVIGCFVHAVDITEQRRTYNALAQAQKMEAIGQLTGGLAHDFNNMLTVVMGNLTALRDVLPDAHKIEEFVTPALIAAEGGADLIKRLLTFSRQQSIDVCPVDVIELVLNITRLIRRSMPRNVTVTTSAQQDDLFALTDPHQLESALLNLAINARDAMPRGGELRIESSLETIDRRAADDLEISPGDYVQIAVSDNGTGMDGAILARIFEPFFTTKSFGMGSGLGMPMVFGFTKQCGGAIRIRSRQAVGTTVALLLPIADAAQANANDSDETAADTLDLHDKLVLLVDDDADVRKVVRTQLAALGCSVLEAETGHEAADMVENVPAIALVLSDVVMPGGMDGRTLARFVKRFRPELPIVLMSGYAEQRSPGQDADTPLLAKPFSREKLAEALRGVPVESRDTR